MRSQSRLNHMLLTIYKKHLDEIDLHNVANEFVGDSKHRLSMFGTHEKMRFQKERFSELVEYSSSEVDTDRHKYIM